MQVNLRQEWAPVVRAYSAGEYDTAITLATTLVSHTAPTDDETLVYANCLYTGGLYCQAESLCRFMLREGSQHVNVRYILAMALVKQEKYQEALPDLKRLVNTLPEKVDIAVALAESLVRTNCVADGLHLLGKLLEAHSESCEVQEALQFLLKELNGNESNAQGGARALVYLVDQHNSAGMHISHVLASQFQLVYHGEIHKPVAYDSVLHPSDAQLFADTGGIARGHLFPRPENLTILSVSGLEKLIVHLRDPRQGIISFLQWSRHLAEQLKTKPDTVGPFEHVFLRTHPADFFERSFDQQFDYYLQWRYPRIIAFQQGWLEAAQCNDWNFKILFTRFEDFKQNPALFYEKIAQFYELDNRPENSTLSSDNDKSSFFRKGAIAEWRELLSSSQQQALIAATPSHLLKHFAWE